MNVRDEDLEVRSDEVKSQVVQMPHIKRNLFSLNVVK